jgi:hypothetical protein
MGAKSHDELNCWQLSVEFRDRVNALLATEPFKRRFKYCDQLADAAESVPSNIAEGFYAFHTLRWHGTFELRWVRSAKRRLAWARHAPRDF